MVKESGLVSASEVEISKPVIKGAIGELEVKVHL